MGRPGRERLAAKPRVRQAPVLPRQVLRRRGPGQPHRLVDELESVAAPVQLGAEPRRIRRHPQHQAASGDRGVRAGLRYVLSSPVVLIVLALSFVLGSLGRNYQVSMAAMAAGPLHGGSGAYGLLSTVFAIGAVGGGLLLAGSGRSTLRVLVASGLTISVLQLFSGLAPNVAGFAALLLPIAAGAVVFDTVVATRIQLDTREDMRGRVLATLGLVSSLSGLVGAPAVGWLSDTLRQAGYAVRPAADGREALDRLRHGPAPDLILLDMLMPVLDGWHFLGRLKQEGPQPPPPILIVTGTILTREWAESHGCCGFLRKPTEPEELLEEVRRCLG